MKTPAPARRPKRPDKAPRRDRDDWLDTARRALIEGGVDRVKVDPLAGLLGVTTGSFYHHFTNRQELLDGLLAHWATRNSESWFQAVREAGPDANAQLDALFDTWVEESAYDPAYDSAVRDWARTSPTVEAAVRGVDDQRIALLQQVFERFGYDPDRAFIRARVTYFHQVGYQAMKITEPHARRLLLRPLYREVLVGKPPGNTG